MWRGPFFYVRTSASLSLHVAPAAVHPKVESLEGSVGKDMRVAIRRAKGIVCSLVWASSCYTRRSSFLVFFLFGACPATLPHFSMCLLPLLPTLETILLWICAPPPHVQPSLALSRRRRPDAAADPLPAPLRQHRRAPPHSRRRLRSAAVAAAAEKTRTTRPSRRRHFTSRASDAAAAEPPLPAFRRHKPRRR